MVSAGESAVPGANMNKQFKASVDPLKVQEITKGTDTRDTLAHARRQIVERNMQDWLVVDVDSHHFEEESWKEIVEYIPNEVIRDIAKNFTYKGNITPGILQAAGWPRHQNYGGRNPHDSGPLEEETDPHGPHRELQLADRALYSMGVDYQVVFPTPMLALGLHPETDVEVALAKGYNRWVVDTILSKDPRLVSLLYLPFNTPEACEDIVKEFGDTPGVVGFMVTSVRYKPVHHNQYMRLYRMIEELGKPIGFHAGPNWTSDGYVRQLNRFVTMHAISFPLCNMVHLTNWIMNGLNERFPKLDVIWIESGISWLAFLTQRLDSEYLMRTAEVPNLKKMPSEYIKDMYYTSQPMERTNMKLLAATFDCFNASTQLLYSSDWPHWDFDLPSTIYDLPFLDEQAKRNIIGLNAKRLFNLPGKKA
jgi:uncharacterized protein